MHLAGRILTQKGAILQRMDMGWIRRMKRNRMLFLRSRFSTLGSKVFSSLRLAKYKLLLQEYLSLFQDYIILILGILVLFRIR